MKPRIYELHVKPDDELVVIRSPAMTSRFEKLEDRANLIVTGNKFQLKTSQNSYSSTKESADEQLMVCQCNGDKLVCRPVAAFHDLRSDFTHLDVVETNEQEAEARMVNIRFASAEHPRNVEPEDEPTESRELALKSSLSREAKSQRALLFGAPVIKPDPDMKPNPVSLPNVTIKTEEDVKPKLSPKKTATANSKIVRELVKECLMKAKLVSFLEVKRFLAALSESAVDKDILDALSEFALLVQGNWAVKSEILYGDSGESSGTDVTGISINLFTAARDYLLCLFNQDRLVSRLTYSRQVKIPDYDILELFNQLAIFRSDIKKWEFKLPTDSEFIERFPDCIQRQVSLWKVRRANKLSMFGAC